MANLFENINIHVTQWVYFQRWNLETNFQFRHMFYNDLNSFEVLFVYKWFGGVLEFLKEKFWGIENSHAHS